MTNIEKSSSFRCEKLAISCCSNPKVPIVMLAIFALATAAFVLCLSHKMNRILPQKSVNFVQNHFKGFLGVSGAISMISFLVALYSLRQIFKKHVSQKKQVTPNSSNLSSASFKKSLPKDQRTIDYIIDLKNAQKQEDKNIFLDLLRKKEKPKIPLQDYKELFESSCELDQGLWIQDLIKYAENNSQYLPVSVGIELLMKKASDPILETCINSGPLNSLILSDSLSYKYATISLSFAFENNRVASFCLIYEKVPSLSEWVCASLIGPYYKREFNFYSRFLSDISCDIEHYSLFLCHLLHRRESFKTFKQAIRDAIFSRQDRSFLIRNLETASSKGNVEVVEFLLSDEQVISLEDKQKAFCCAAQNNHLKVARILFPDVQRLSRETLEKALINTSKNNYKEVIHFLLSGETRISINALGESVINAASEGHIEILQLILSGERTISEEHLSAAVNKAVSKRDLRSLEFLLSNERTISTAHLGNAVFRASSLGYPDILEVLLRRGRIFESIRNTSLSAARNVTNLNPRNQVLDLLDTAAVLPDPTSSELSNTGVFSIYTPSADEYVLESFQAVKDDPGFYLEDVARTGFPHRIFLKESPSVVDLSGVTKEFLTTIFESCMEKGLIKVSDEGLAIGSLEKYNSHLENVAKLFNQLETRNRTRNDKFLVGELFGTSFYELVKKVVVKKISDEQLLIEVAKKFLDKDEYTAKAARFVIHPQDEKLKKEYSDLGIIEEDEIAFESAASQFMSYVHGVKAFVVGMEEDLKKHFRDKRPEVLKEMFQGRSCTTEALLASLQFSESTEESFIVKKGWLLERIETSDVAWRKTFVKSITGNRTLFPGVKILIHPSLRNWTFEIHTCFNSLEILSEENIDKNTFLDLLDWTIKSKGYNTA